DPEVDPGPRFRNSAGILIGYHFSDDIGVGIEPTLSGEGIRYEPQKPDPDVEWYRLVNLTFLKLPVLFRFNTDPTKRAAFQGFIGPQFSFVTGANWFDYYKARGYDAESETIKSFDFKSISATAPLPIYESNRSTPDYYEREVADMEVRESSKGQKPLKDLYRGLTIGAALGLGFKIKIVEGLYVDGLARLDFHFTDVEAKNKYIVAEYGDFNGTTFVKKGEFDFWDYQRTLLKSRRDDRAPSLPLSAGFQIGITYVLNFSD
ncbi:MAG: PorT family protein, partial [Bacteroidia bacterium]|nr:PorT family protein [Bacteroidia bacterium]